MFWISSDKRCTKFIVSTGKGKYFFFVFMFGHWFFNGCLFKQRLPFLLRGGASDFNQKKLSWSKKLNPWSAPEASILVRWISGWFTVIEESTDLRVVEITYKHLYVWNVYIVCIFFLVILSALYGKWTGKEITILLLKKKTFIFLP